MTNIAVLTTFPNNCWNVYAEKMISSFCQNFDKEIPLLIQLDNDLLLNDVAKITRPSDGIAVNWYQEYYDFVERNKGKDSPQNYRKQATRFCHKVFALKQAVDTLIKAKNEGFETPKYLIWLDADVIITKKVTIKDLKKCLPKKGHTVSYLGRKDWDHSECGWLAFDLENGGKDLIDAMYQVYIDDTLFEMQQWHDSYVFDELRKPYKCTNLTEGKPGNEIWQHSPMAEWSTHYKGPLAKQALFNANAPQQLKPPAGQNFIIQTKNAIPDEQIRKHIEENQKLIKNWVSECKKTNETLVIVSAGPSLLVEDLEPEIKAGRKIVAVKHALTPLKKGGITPWACILLDPREHVKDFVLDADNKIIWFVASQCNPEVTKTLLQNGCEVWGYHASVNAGEHELTAKQPNAVITGGSATATRGLYLLNRLGFYKFNLYGYDLSLPDKPDLNSLNEFGQPKYLEFNVSIKNQYVDSKRQFYSEPQLIAQFEEFNALMNSEKFELKAFGYGMVPYIMKLYEVTKLRDKKIKCMIGKKFYSYKTMLLWSKWKKTSLYKILHKMLLICHLKQRANSKLLRGLLKQN